MKNILIVSFFILSTFVSVFQSMADDKRMPEAEIAKLPQDVQKFIRYNRHLKDDLGYEGVKAVSFSDSKTHYALTSIYKGKKENHDTKVIYTAEVSSIKNKAELSFRLYKDCIPTNRERLIEKTIKINDKKINAYYICDKESVNAPKGQEMYFLKSQPGKDFAYAEFIDNTFVFVEFDNVKIPFDTTGFIDAWDEVSEPAL